VSIDDTWEANMVADVISRGGQKVTLDLFETLAVVLLALGTIGSAWCAFQAARWNGEEADNLSRAQAARIESTKQANLATTKVAYDAGLVAQYATAVAEGQTALREFYRQKLFRPEFLPVLDQWLGGSVATAANAPNFFENQEYLDSLLGPTRRLDEQSQEFARQADRAGRNADDYILNTVLLATVLFFAGVSSNYRRISLRFLLVTIAALLLAVAASRIASLPVL
jgi:hypothetical protein